ncbi:2400_t:CDS:2, partial [Gigaspora margarita]
MAKISGLDMFQGDIYSYKRDGNEYFHKFYQYAKSSYYDITDMNSKFVLYPKAKDGNEDGFDNIYLVDKDKTKLEVGISYSLKEFVDKLTAKKDYVDKIRIISYDKTEQTYTSKWIKKDHELFCAIIGGSSGNFSVIIYVRLMVLKDSDYPKSYRLFAICVYDPNVLKEFLDIMLETKTINIDDLDYCITFLSNSGSDQGLDHEDDDDLSYDETYNREAYTRNMNFGVVFDTFFEKDLLHLASKWQRENDKCILVPNPTFCDKNMRLLWASYDLNLDYFHDHYYDSKKKYIDLYYLREKYNPRKIFFIPNNFCVGVKNEVSEEELKNKLDKNSDKFDDLLKDD